MQAEMKTKPIQEMAGVYELASASTENTVLAVRFAPNASLVEITIFLDAFNASIFDGPGPGGLCKLRIAGATLPQAEAQALIDRLTKEGIVEFAAAVQ